VPSELPSQREGEAGVRRVTRSYTRVPGREMGHAYIGVQDQEMYVIKQIGEDFVEEAG
jgi:hypothetical protein